MFRRIVTFTLLTLMLTTVTQTEDRDDWIDPYDMINFDPSTNTMKKDKVQLNLKKPVTQEPQHFDEKNSKGCPTCDSCPSCKECPQGVECPPCAECPQCSECKVEEEVRTCEKHDNCPACNCDQPRECVCEQASLPLLRKYITTLLKHLDDKSPLGGAEDFVMHISLSADNVRLLEKFVKDGNQIHVHDVHEILTNMIDKIWSSKLGRLEKMVEWFEYKIGLKLERIIQFLLLGALASVILLIEIRLQIAWRRRISQLIVLMFVVSIPWTWFELYKHAEIKQQSVASKQVPKECEGGEPDYWTAMKSYFTFQDDKCFEYHQHLLIDPLVKVPPTKAIAITFVRFFIAPLKDVGGAISEFLRALLIDLPVTLYPVAIAVVAMFLFMFLFMWFGYSIRLPFFLTIERSPQLSVADNQLCQAIQDSSQQTISQLEKLQARLDATESQIAERLVDLTQVQQAAIEYNRSSSHLATPSGSPSMSRSEVTEKSEVKVTTTAAKKLDVSSPSLYSHDSTGIQDVLNRGEPDKSSDTIECDTRKSDISKTNKVNKTSANIDTLKPN